jgi:YcxB-like protein
MTTSYNLDQQDYLTHLHYASSHTERFIRMRKRTRLMMPCFFILIGLLLIGGESKTLSIIYFILAPVWYFFYPMFEKGSYTKQFKKFVQMSYKGVIDKITSFELEDDFISTKISGGESKVPTSEIEVIDEISSAVYIKLKSGATIILPKNKVSNIDAFIAHLKEIAKAHGVGYNVENDWVWK